MKSQAVVDRKEGDLIVLIFKGYNVPVALPARFLPGVKEGDILDVSFNLRKGKQKEKDKINEMIKDLQNR